MGFYVPSHSGFQPQSAFTSELMGEVNDGSEYGIEPTAMGKGNSSTVYTKMKGRKDTKRLVKTREGKREGESPRFAY